MDAARPRPQGPRYVDAKWGVTIGRELLEPLGVGVKDGVWVVANPTLPGTIVVMPGAVIDEIMAHGWPEPTAFPTADSEDR